MKISVDANVWEWMELMFGCSCAFLHAFSLTRKGVQAVKIVGPKRPLEGVAGRPIISGIIGEFHKCKGQISKRIFLVKSVRIEGSGWVEASSLFNGYGLPIMMPGDKKKKGE